MYIENDETICAGCFKKIDNGANSCPYCGRKITAESVSTALKKGIKLKERYVVGDLIFSDDLINRYISYDTQIAKVVYLIEYMPKILASRSNSVPELNIPDESNFANYNNGLQVFSSSASFFKDNSDRGLQRCLDIFYENFTAYAVFERVEGPSCASFIRDFKGDKALIVNLLKPILIGLDKLHRAGYNFGRISHTKIIFRNGDIEAPVLCEPDLYNHIDLNMDTYCFTGELSVFSPLEAYMTKYAKSHSNDIYSLCLSICACIDEEILTEFEKNRKINTTLITNKGFSSKIAFAFDKACSENFEDRYLNAYEMIRDIGLVKQVPPMNTNKKVANEGKRKKTDKKRNIFLVCTLFFIVVLILLLMLFVRSCGNSSAVSNSSSEKTESNSDVIDSILDESTDNETVIGENGETDKLKPIPDGTEGDFVQEDSIKEDEKKPEDSSIISNINTQDSKKEEEFPVIEKKVTGISVLNTPKKTEYTEGDRLSVSGLKISVVYNDGTTEVITSGFSVNPSNDTILKTSNNKVTVTYSGKTATFDILVISRITETEAEPEEDTEESYVTTTVPDTSEEPDISEESESEEETEVQDTDRIEETTVEELDSEQVIPDEDV